MGKRNLRKRKLNILFLRVYFILSRVIVIIIILKNYSEYFFLCFFIF